MSNIVFMGTPEFAVPTLKALVQSHHRVLAVITNPDRPSGRGRKKTPPPVKRYALTQDIPHLFQPTTLRNKALYESIQALEPEFFIVVAYGRILGPKYLSLPKIAPINVHASILPKYRGAAPIQWAMIRGERETGVSIMKMDRGMDTGPVYAVKKTTILEKDNAQTLHDRLAKLGASLLIETLEQIQRGKQPVDQDHPKATYAPMLTKAHGALRLDQPAQILNHRIRGLTPWPGAYLLRKDQKIKVIRALPLSLQTQSPHGTVVQISTQGIDIAVAQGCLRIQKLQPPAKRPMDAWSYVQGYKVEVGELWQEAPEARNPDLGWN